MNTTSETTLEPRPSTALAWLRLIRIPTVFTALSNVLCGYFVTRLPVANSLADHPTLFWLLASTTGLYLGGMVLNDVFDASLDAIERPERPIPSGQISRTAAACFGAFLMLVGIGAAAFVGMLSLAVAVLITVAVLSYDARLKSTPFGPFNMGLCRGLNLLLGASTIPIEQLQKHAVVVSAIALAVYIVGVTWFSRSEAGTSSRKGMIWGLSLILLALAAQAWNVTESGISARSINGSRIVFLLIGLNLTARAANVITRPHSGRIQKTVGLMLMSLIFLDANLTFGLTGDARLSAIIIMLVAPASLLRRFIPMS
ncbi:MAG: UbiA family prenyltransferase [Planctomycetaceae bacterium]|nr:UbiA family prenyltransferase [Planctomycetaceae bacterium]